MNWIHSLPIATSFVLGADKDVFWWTREKGDDREHQLADELARVKAREEELMLEVRTFWSPWGWMDNLISC